MFPSPSLVCVFLLFIPHFAMLLASCYFYFFRSFSSSGPFPFFNHLLLFSCVHLLNILFPCSSFPSKETVVPGPFPNTAVICCAGQTMLGQRPGLQLGKLGRRQCRKSLLTHCSASLERIFTFEEIKTSTRPKHSEFVQTCSGFCLFLNLPLHLD